MAKFKERRRLAGGSLRPRGGARMLLVHLAILAVFGVVFPWMRPAVFLDPVVPAAYACLGLLFAGPAAAQAFALERPQSTTEALARAIRAAAYGELISALVLLAAFATVYMAHRYAFAPDLGTLPGAVWLGLAASLAAACVAGWITLYASAPAARRLLRVAFLFLLALFLLHPESLPDMAPQAALLCLLIAAAALYAISRAVAKSA
jgi:hypothetical protein